MKSAHSGGRRAPRTAKNPGRPSAGLVLGACAAGAAAALPAIYLVVRALEASSVQIVDVLGDRQTLVLLRNTLWLTFAVTAAAVFLGVPAAWVIVRTDLPMRRFWTVTNALPLVLPSYLGGYAFVACLGPRGMVQNWLEPLGVERLPEIYGFRGAWFVLTLFTYPYVFLGVRGALLRIDPSIEEAAATLGQGSLGRFRKVILPQIWPAIASSGLLVALYTVHDFGAVSLLRFDSFSRAIYLSYEGSFDRTEAAILSLLLVVTSIILVAGEIRLRPGSHIYRIHGSGGRIARRTSLGTLRWPVLGAFAVVGGLALALPLGVIGFWAVRGMEAQTFAGNTFSAAGNSLAASIAGTALAMTAAWPLSALAARFPGRLSSTLERSAYVAYALPGIVVALSLVFLGIKIVPWLYQTRFMLAFAYAVLFLPLAAGAIKTSMTQFNPRLDEAARTLGATRWRRFRLVGWPAYRPGIVTAAALVFLSAMKELPASLLLAPVGFSSLATRIWGATQSASFAAAAVPALALVLLSSVPLGYLLSRDENRSLLIEGTLAAGPEPDS